MLRSEVGSGESDRKASKANGSDSAALEADKAESGNGLSKEFSDTVVAQIKPSAGAKGDDSVTNEASGSTNGDKADANATSGKLLADGLGTGMRAESASDAKTSAGARANGEEAKATDGVTGISKLKPTGVGDAFPSNAQLLNQLKV